MVKQNRWDLQTQIVIVRALPGLGDLLCAIPAWRSLRAALPQAKITLIGLPWAKTFVSRFRQYIDELWEFPGYPGIPEVSPQITDLPKFFTRVQQQHFDLALQMHGNGNIINSFTVLLGAQANAGFYLPGQYCPDPERFLPYPASEPEVWRHLHLMEFLGIPLQGTDLEFPLTEEDFVALNAIPEVKHLTRKEYVCIHPGASVAERRWSTKKFAIVADFLVKRGLQVVLTGTTAEIEVTQAVRSQMQHGDCVIDLAGHTSLGAIAALLNQAKLLVCNDTGVSHLAAALKVKSVVIFSASDPHRWAPLDRDRHRILSTYSRVSCEEASHQRCLREDCTIATITKNSNQRLIPPEAVITEVENLLSEVTYV